MLVIGCRLSPETLSIHGPVVGGSVLISEKHYCFSSIISNLRVIRFNATKCEITLDIGRELVNYLLKQPAYYRATVTVNGGS